MQVEYARHLGNTAHSIPTMGSLMLAPLLLCRRCLSKSRILTAFITDWLSQEAINMAPPSQMKQGLQVYKWCRATTGCDGSTNEGQLARTCWWLRASQLTMSIASGWLDGVREFGLILSDFDPLFNSCSMHVQTSEHTQGARERERETETSRNNVEIILW